MSEKRMSWADVKGHTIIPNQDNFHSHVEASSWLCYDLFIVIYEPFVTWSNNYYYYYFLIIFDSEILSESEQNKTKTY